MTPKELGTRLSDLLSAIVPDDLCYVLVVSEANVVRPRYAAFSDIEGGVMVAYLLRLAADGAEKRGKLD